MASSTQRATSSLPSALEWKYDVFLSFRGETRLGFTAHLLKELEEQGITRTFVISPKYTSSKWCLNELVKILECMEKRDAVIPVFYEVEPCDIGDRSGSFGKGFTELEEKCKDDKEMVERWKAALTKVAKIKGCTSKNREEPELIQKIVENVRNEVGPLSLYSMASATQRATSSVHSDLEWKYDVFLSFCGADTRLRFTAHLLDKLQEEGITRTFFDEKDLKKGRKISQLFPAIEKSRLAIVVISPNYASSKWCLNELVKIPECMEKRDAVIPVFYSVEPYDVRYQLGSFGKGFTQLKQKPEYKDKKEMVEQWEAALETVGKINGFTSNNREEPELIRKIVENVRNEVEPLSLEPAEKLVDIDSKLKELDVLLELESNDVLFIGIWGMSGIGKTTLAKACYERIRHKFQAKSFHDGVREDSKAHGMAGVQRKLSNSLRKRNIQDWDAGEAVSWRSFLLENKVLIILDDVDDSNHC